MSIDNGVEAHRINCRDAESAIVIGNELYKKFGRVIDVMEMPVDIA